MYNLTIMNIKNEVYKMLKERTSQKFDDNSDIFEIGIDSLDLVELITDVEDKFNIVIPDEEIEKIKKIKDVIEIFEKNKK